MFLQLSKKSILEEDTRKKIPLDRSSVDTLSSSTFTFANCKVVFNMKWNLYKMNSDNVIKWFNKMKVLFGAVIL